MKKLNILFFVLCLISITSCEDRKDLAINPLAETGTLTFKLNSPKYTNMTYVLEDANATNDMEVLTCVQPDYGFKASVTYAVQVGFDDQFATGKFQSLPTSVVGEKVSMNTKEMDKAIIALYGGKLPDPVVAKDVYIRLMATISDATHAPTDTVLTVKPLYSNTIKIKILPYVLPLFPYTELAPRTWYIVGLGDGAWNNSVAGLGKSLIPLNVTSGKKYNLSGDGEFSYTGYFEAAKGFKLIRDIGSWGEQWGMTGTNYTHNSGDNIKVAADGYYTLTLNSIDNTLTMVAATAPTKNYNSMGLIGEFNSWASDVAMTPVFTTNNHLWYTSYTFSADFTSGGGCKFRANGGWDANWGAATFPFGIGTPGGANIQFKAGTYVVVLNDIDGTYSFIKK